ncbi:hypothetical protein HAX54_045230 [Datura stramonium]|uniref:OTU domain-containing protein n=1 Tax=Datura stramonium TaxID=4076 RepID=A0ABS8RHP4_DATST|nr:hypothetical protein [Datura stramonium]
MPSETTEETASHVSESFIHLLDSDEIRVETIAENAVDGTCLYRASICCEYRPDLLSELKEIINSLRRFGILVLQLLDKVSAFPEYSAYPNKRPRISCTILQAYSDRHD